MKECVLSNWICSSPFMLNVKSILVKSHFYKQCRTVLAWTVYQAGLAQGELRVRCAVTKRYITQCFVFYPKLRRRKSRTLAPLKVTFEPALDLRGGGCSLYLNKGRTKLNTIHSSFSPVFISSPLTVPRQTACRYLSISASVLFLARFIMQRPFKVLYISRNDLIRHGKVRYFLPALKSPVEPTPSNIHPVQTDVWRLALNRFSPKPNRRYWLVV